MENLEKGTLVEFKNPNLDEIGTIFAVVEDRDTRVLVELYNCSLPLVPTFVYLKEDLKIFEK